MELFNNVNKDKHGRKHEEKEKRVVHGNKCNMTADV